MKKLKKTEVLGLINEIKQKVSKTPNGATTIKINVFRAIKEFLLKHQNEIYKYQHLYFIEDKWVYDTSTPKKIQPLPNKGLFCGFCDSNDDTYHYWLKNKKHIQKYGITYKDYKNFNSINWFITGDNQLYINHKYYSIKGENNEKI